MIDAIKYIEKIALVIIIFATVIAIGYEIYAMYEKILLNLPTCFCYLFISKLYK